jgi:hypothetical protein
MGLFDWLKGEEEQGSAEPSLDEAPARPSAAAPARPSTAAPTQPKPAETAKAAPRRDTKAEDMPEFGIQKAIELMRDLPQQNIELVVQVVKKTLESMQVDVVSIIEDAKTRQAKIQGRIKDLEEEIAELREEIAAREGEIAALKTDFAETRQVRERLEMAQKSASPARPDVVAPPVGRGPGAKPPGEQKTTASGEFKAPGN